jgi:hypothetical protein
MSEPLNERLRRYAEELIHQGANAGDLRRDLQEAANFIEQNSPTAMGRMEAVLRASERARIASFLRQLSFSTLADRIEKGEHWTS